MIKIKFHGQTAFDNGLLDIHLKIGDTVELTKAQYLGMRKDMSEPRFRSEVEILSPAKLRQVNLISNANSLMRFIDS